MIYQAASEGLGNGPDKQLTRKVLVEAVIELLGRGPFVICTFPGQEAYDVQLFRERWPSARIVCLERVASTARQTKAHQFPRLIATGEEENVILQVDLKTYANAPGNPALTRRLQRRFRDGKEQRAIEPRGTILPYDFPSFELAFLDASARYDNPTVYREIGQFIDNHCAATAVVGITLNVVQPAEQRDMSTEQIVEQVREQTSRHTRVIGEPMEYHTQTAMLFFMLAVEPNEGR